MQQVERAWSCGCPGGPWGRGPGSRVGAAPADREGLRRKQGVSRGISGVLAWSSLHVQFCQLFGRPEPLPQSDPRQDRVCSRPQSQFSWGPHSPSQNCTHVLTPPPRVSPWVQPTGSVGLCTLARKPGVTKWSARETRCGGENPMAVPGLSAGSLSFTSYLLI